MNPKFVLPKIGELPVSASIESICKFEKVATTICDTEKNGAKEFAGEHIKIHSPEFPDWNSVIKYIFEKENI